jgi:hypothetical protein
MRVLSYSLATSAALAIAFAAGCTSTPTAFGGNLAIQSPIDNAAMNAPLDLQVAVNFSTNFTLRSPGTCAGQGGCGHVYLTIDSSECNAIGKDYNALAISSPTDVSLANCNMPLGQHRITAELHDDSGAVVTGTGTGDPVAASVTINVQ